MKPFGRIKVVNYECWNHLRVLVSFYDEGSDLIVLHTCNLIIIQVNSILLIYVLTQQFNDQLRNQHKHTNMTHLQNKNQKKRNTNITHIQTNKITEFKFSLSSMIWLWW